METVATDPLIACPIVCGEYMRATGFFYRSDSETYLITARHNILPTDGQTLYSGSISMRFRTPDVLLPIDLYLRTDTGFKCKRVTVRNRPGTVHTSEIDVLAVPIEFNPEAYGHHVWTADETTSPRYAAGSLDVVGFNGRGFPDKDESYSRDFYQDALGQPVRLQVGNEMVGEDDISRFGLFGPGVDKQFVGDDAQYNGLSGAPVVGDDLVGIHSQNVDPPPRIADQFNSSGFMLTLYTRAEALPKML